MTLIIPPVSKDVQPLVIQNLNTNDNDNNR
jgi:hypothetical protein